LDFLGHESGDRRFQVSLGFSPGISTVGQEMGFSPWGIACAAGHLRAARRQATLSLMATHRQKLTTYAITILTHQRHRLFQRSGNADLMIATLFRYRDQGRFALHAFAVMPDHLHVLVTPAIDVSTARCVQFIKGGYSFAIRKQYAEYPFVHTKYEGRLDPAPAAEAAFEAVAGCQG
jgi:REP element-mobilizing transposase RayT